MQTQLAKFILDGHFLKCFHHFELMLCGNGFISIFDVEREQQRIDEIAYLVDLYKWTIIVYLNIDIDLTNSQEKSKVLFNNLSEKLLTLVRSSSVNSKSSGKTVSCSSKYGHLLSSSYPSPVRTEM